MINLMQNKKKCSINQYKLPATLLGYDYKGISWDEITFSCIIKKKSFRFNLHIFLITNLCLITTIIAA